MQKKDKKIRNLELQNEHLRDQIYELRAENIKLKDAGAQLHEAHLAIMISTALCYGEQKDGKVKLILPKVNIKDMLAKYDYYADWGEDDTRTLEVWKKEAKDGADVVQGIPADGTEAEGKEEAEVQEQGM